MTNTRSRRRWFSYSLRGLLLAITGFAIWLGWWANSARNQQEAVAAMRAVDSHSNISYDDDVIENPYSLPAAAGYGAPGGEPERKSWVPQFIQDALGEDYFRNVVGVGFGEVAADPVKAAAETDVFRKIAKLRHLNQLVIYFAVSDSDVAQIAKSRSINRLEFGKDCPQLTDDALRSVARMSSLTSLTIRNAPITDAGLAHLKQMSQLKELVLGKVDVFAHPTNTLKITDDGFAFLAGLTNLESLEINSVNMTGDGLKHLTGLKNLKSLSLDCPLVKDDDLQALAALTNLESLVLTGPEIDGTGFKQLSSLPKLSSLCLEGPKFCDQAIPFLARLPSLSSVMLYHTRVTAAGLEQFKTAPNLRQIGLDPAVTGDTKRLKQALPNTGVSNNGNEL